MGVVLLQIFLVLLGLLFLAGILAAVDRGRAQNIRDRKTFKGNRAQKRRR